MDITTAPLSHELFKEMCKHPQAEVYCFPFTVAGLKLYEEHSKSMREFGFRVVSEVEIVAGHKLNVMVAVPAARPSRKERGL